MYDVHGEEGVKQHSAGGGGGSGNMAQDIFSQCVPLRLPAHQAPGGVDPTRWRACFLG